MYNRFIHSFTIRLGAKPVNIEATTIKQLLQLQLLNKMNLITSGDDSSGTSDASGEDDFASILNSVLGGQVGGAASASAGGSDPLASLQALASMSSGSMQGLPLDIIKGSSYRPASFVPSALAQAQAKAQPYGRNGYAADPAAGKPSAYELLIRDASATFGVDPSLVKAVIHQESSFNPYAVSAAGAKGLMQLMDGTGEGFGVTDPFDPQQNVQAGTQFLAGLLHKYNGNEGVALAAYNAGPGRIDRLGIRTDAELADKLNLLPQETQQYVRRVLNLKEHYA